jgi:hypothetical protein
MFKVQVSMLDVNSPMPDHVKIAESKQAELVRSMTPGRRLEIANSLYETAWAIKSSALRDRHPEWSDEILFARLRRIFLTGYAGD